MVFQSPWQRMRQRFFETRVFLKAKICASAKDHKRVLEEEQDGGGCCVEVRSVAG